VFEALNLKTPFQPIASILASISKLSSGIAKNEMA